MRPVQFLLAALMFTGMCLSQEQGSSQGTTPPQDQKGQVTATQGQKTVVGCIAMGAPSGFVLKGEDGKTYPLRTDRDLGPFVGKKVQITAAWTRTGVSMVEAENEQVPAEQAGQKKTTSAETFGGSINLRYRGKVLGNCR
jgi:Protein of unknown function (DUF5818)